MKIQTDVYPVSLKQGISRTPEFEKKMLATHGVNCGLLCGHGCRYCSTPALVRAHQAFQRIGKTAFADNIAVVDPDTPARIEKDLARLKPTDTVMLCTISDAWAPEAKAHNLGRRCLKLLLEESFCQVRILTKNAAVIQDFDLLQLHRERVQLGLSVTAPQAKAQLLSALEPNASPLAERIAALHEAHAAGIQTYGMLCPCLPGIADDEAGLKEMMQTALDCGAKEIWLEPVNARGKGLTNCARALGKIGECEIARQVDAIRNCKKWAAYVRRFCETAVKVAGDLDVIEELRILIYPKRLDAEGKAAIRQLPGIIWLG